MEVFEKELNQTDKVEEETNKVIGNMGAIWKACSDKLTKDNICFICKKPIGKKDKFNMAEVPPDKVDKGLFVLAAICNKCK